MHRSSALWGYTTSFRLPNKSPSPALLVLIAHSETLARVSFYCTISLAERLRVVGRCCRMHGYGPGRWLALWGILTLGCAAFVAGRFARGFANQGRRG